MRIYWGTEVIFLRLGNGFRILAVSSVGDAKSELLKIDCNNLSDAVKMDVLLGEHTCVSPDGIITFDFTCDSYWQNHSSKVSIEHCCGFDRNINRGAVQAVGWEVLEAADCAYDVTHCNFSAAWYQCGISA